MIPPTIVGNTLHWFESTPVTTDADGNASFTNEYPGTPLVDVVTATATNTTTGDTSEFSQPVEVEHR
jgi:hypothetical protein